MKAVVYRAALTTGICNSNFLIAAKLSHRIFFAKNLKMGVFF